MPQGTGIGRRREACGAGTRTPVDLRNPRGQESGSSVFFVVVGGPSTVVFELCTVARKPLEEFCVLSAGCACLVSSHWHCFDWLLAADGCPGLLFLALGHCWSSVRLGRLIRMQNSSSLPERALGGSCRRFPLASHTGRPPQWCDMWPYWGWPRACCPSSSTLACFWASRWGSTCQLCRDHRSWLATVRFGFRSWRADLKTISNKRITVAVSYWCKSYEQTAKTWSHNRLVLGVKIGFGRSIPWKTFYTWWVEEAPINVVCNYTARIFYWQVEQLQHIHFNLRTVYPEYFVRTKFSYAGDLRPRTHGISVQPLTAAGLWLALSFLYRSRRVRINIRKWKSIRNILHLQ